MNRLKFKIAFHVIQNSNILAANIKYSLTHEDILREIRYTNLWIILILVDILRTSIQLYITKILILFIYMYIFNCNSTQTTCHREIFIGAAHLKCSY